MTKEDIKEGDIVLLRDGRICIVMPDIYNPIRGLALYGRYKYTMDREVGKVIAFNEVYNDDLTSLYDRDYNIMAVRKDTYSSYNIMAVRKDTYSSSSKINSLIFKLLFSLIDPKDITWDWEREEVKEVTMADVEEKFGCKVKIIKEK